MQDGEDRVSPEHRWGRELPRLATPRALLRHPRVADAPALFAVFSDAEVVRYWSSEAMREPREAVDLVRGIAAGYRARDLFEWVVVRRADDRVVGTTTLFHFADGGRRAEIGFALARPAWGRGLMREVLTELIGFAFGRLGLARLEADVDPRNDRSLGLLARLGFRREGLLRERYHVAGEIQDSVMLGLLAREWADAPGGARGPRAGGAG